MIELAAVIVLLILLIWIFRGSSNNPIIAKDTEGYGVPYVPPPPFPITIGGTCIGTGSNYVINAANCKLLQYQTNPDGTCAVPTCSSPSAEQLVFTSSATGADATVRLPGVDANTCTNVGGVFSGNTCQTYMIKKSSLNNKTKYYGPLSPSMEEKTRAALIANQVGTYYSSSQDACAGKYDPATKICKFNWYSFTS